MGREKYAKTITMSLAIPGNDATDSSKSANSYVGGELLGAQVPTLSLGFQQPAFVPRSGFDLCAQIGASDADDG